MGRGATRGGRGGRGGGGSRGGRGGRGGKGGPREAASSNADEGFDFGGGDAGGEAKAAAKRKAASQDTHRSGRTSMQHEDMYDEVDDFMEARHGGRIALDRNAPQHDSDDDEEEAVYARSSKGKGKNKHSTAFELEGLEPDEDEDDDDEAEQDAPDFDAVEAQERADARKREIAAEEHISTNWGKSKNAYYSADTADFELQSDDEPAKQEEEEGRRLQSKSVAELAAHTDEADDMLAMVAAAAEDGDATAAGSSGKQSKKKGAKELPSDAELLKSFQEDMDGLDMNLDLDLDIAALTQATAAPTKGKGKKGSVSAASAITVERITKDLSRVSEEDKLEMVMASSPELIDLLESFKNRLAALQETMPIWEEIKDQQEMKSTPWYAFVSFKVTTLLLYCSHVSFYLSLKAKGKANMQSHEITNTMAKLESRIAELDALDEHFATQRALEETNDDDDEEEGQEEEAAMLDEDEEDEQDGEDEEDEHLQDEDQDGADLEDGEDDEDAFPEDAPLDPSNLAQADLMSRQTAALSRLLEGVSSVPAKPKKKQQALAASAAKHKALSDFGEVDHRAEMAKSLTVGKSSGKLAALQAKLQAEQAAEEKKAAKKNKKRKPSDADEDDPELKAEDDEAGGWGSKASGAAKKPKPALDAEEAALQAKGAALYAKVAAASKDAKALKASVYEPKVLPANWKTMSEDERRAVSKQINANRGLVRSRPKDRKNPKTANRLRYEKKMVARSGAVQVYKGSQEANYGGQATGIKTTLTKSISLRG